MSNLLLFAVTPTYVDLLINNKECVPDEFKTIIYTTDIKKVKKVFPNSKVLKYNSEVFYYFDKFKYAIELSQSLKETVLYVDVGRLCETKTYISNVDLSTIKNICFTATWGEIENAEELYHKKSSFFENGYWNEILDKMKNDVDLKKVLVFLERVFVVPYKESLKYVLNELELIRKLFENQSQVKRSVYSGVGNGEGLGMGYVISKTNEPYEFIKQYVNKQII